MMRYLRLYLCFLRFSFSKAMEFRVDFFFRVVMDTVYYGIHLAFFAVVYQHTALLGGWDLDQVLIFAAGFFVIDGLHMTVFANNMWWMPHHINKGDLDYYLVRPVKPLFMLSVRDFAANSFLNLVIACGILAWALGRYPHPLSAADITLYVLLLINGTFVYYLVHLAFIIPVFWTHSNRGFGDLFHRMQAFMERPDRIFKGWLRRLLVTALPFSLMVSMPARVVLEEWTGMLLVHVLGITVLLFIGVMAFWKAALRSYASASS